MGAGHVHVFDWCSAHAVCTVEECKMMCAPWRAQNAVAGANVKLGARKDVFALQTVQVWHWMPFPGSVLRTGYE